MNPKQYPKGLPNVVSSKFFQEMSTKSKDIASILSEKWYDLTWHCNSSSFNLHRPQKISTGFKMVVLTPKLSMGIFLHAKYLLTKYFRSSYYCRKTGLWLLTGLNSVYHSRVWVKKFQVLPQASFPKLI